MSLRSPSAGLAGLFAALADPTRLRLLNLMAGREICVCYLIEILRLSQPKISRHLAYLRREGLVVARREGKWMHYRVVEPAQPATAAVLRATLSVLDADKQMQAERARLERACCGPQALVQLRDAPRPTPSRLEPARRNSTER